jgi:hypothetical protein
MNSEQNIVTLNKCCSVSNARIQNMIETEENYLSVMPVF